MSNNWLRFRGTLLRMRGSGGEYPLWFAGLHAHGNKFPISSGWVLDKSGGPFWLSVKRVQIIGGKESDRMLRLDSGFAHLFRILERKA